MQVGKHIVIWGAGKIGRGFIGDIFDQGGYSLDFVDANIEFIKSLKKQGFYTINNVKSKEDATTRIIKDFSITHSENIEQIHTILMKTDLLAIVVFPQAFDDTARKIAEHIENRMNTDSAKPLDILLCANISHPEAIIRKKLNEFLSDRGKKYLENSVGLVETLVIRMAVQPTKKMLEEDPFAVMTNGYEKLTANSLAFQMNCQISRGYVLQRILVLKKFEKSIPTIWFMLFMPTQEV